MQAKSQIVRIKPKSFALLLVLATMPTLLGCRHVSATSESKTYRIEARIGAETCSWLPGDVCNGEAVKTRLGMTLSRTEGGPMAEGGLPIDDTTYQVSRPYAPAHLVTIPAGSKCISIFVVAHTLAIAEERKIDAVELTRKVGGAFLDGQGDCEANGQVVDLEWPKIPIMQHTSH